MKSSIASASLARLRLSHRDRLAELARLGVTQFNLYLMNGDKEHEVHEYARESFRGFVTDFFQRST
jgi:hypothetical protein